MALPPEIANFDYKSVFFGPDYVHNVVSGVTVVIMSALLFAIYKALSPFALGFFKSIGVILALAIFMFLGLVALRVSAPNPVPAIILPPMSLPQWPKPLTKDEITDWGKTLAVYHPSVVILTLINDQQLPFTLGLSEVLRQAKWPEPSIQAGHYVLGVHIVAGKNADNIGQALRQLIEKDGVSTDYDLRTTTDFPDQGITVEVGWPPP